MRVSRIRQITQQKKQLDITKNGDTESDTQNDSQATALNFQGGAAKNVQLGSKLQNQVQATPKIKED